MQRITWSRLLIGLLALLLLAALVKNLVGGLNRRRAVEPAVEAR